MSQDSDARTVVIVGGGFTGAAVALHLARPDSTPPRYRIFVFEPRTRLGYGLAYDTDEPTHRINVPAVKMSLYGDDPESFQRYVEQRNIVTDDPASLDQSGQIFPARSVFGDYVSHELAPHLASGAIRHVKSRVVSVTRKGPHWIVRDEAGDAIQADIVVLAVSHPAPSLPRALETLKGHHGLIVEGARADVLDAIGKDDRLLIVGNGLTAADVIAALERRGHRGPTLAISRRGLRSKGHATSPQEPFGDFLSPPSTSATALLARVRSTVREAASKGIGWHSVLDAVRQQGQQIWRALPISERRRIARHIRAFWDVHRFRIAPQLEQVLDQAIAAGRLKVIAAGLQSAQLAEDCIVVTLRPRGRRQPEEIAVDSIIVTTGPAHGDILDSQAFLRGLRDDGVLTPCLTGLGIACDQRSRAIDADAHPNSNFLIAGPLARGTFGELMGLPQVSDHAYAVAQTVHEYLQSPDSFPDKSRAGRDTPAKTLQKDAAL